MTQLTNDFLYRFYELLKKDNWGAIEPEWFDPDFLDPEYEEPTSPTQYPNNEQGWAKALQEAVEQALEETAPGKYH